MRPQLRSTIVFVGDSSERRHLGGGNQKTRETWEAKIFPSTLEPLALRRIMFRPSSTIIGLRWRMNGKFRPLRPHRLDTKWDTDL